uniref:ATP synthase CF0 subunit I n=1 Tax=Sphondylothamnion multifidum TaxID=193186 RepID=A0A4D6X109_9FLOR|nr:ATP synthase CF0 subunit I [Sphondylothamnion multifidum]
MESKILQLVSELYISVNPGISFNSNFLEANVLNISLLLAGLIYVLKQFLGSILSERQDKVILAINESEERLQQANIRLDEANKQLAQTQLIIEQIIQEAEITAQRVHQSILEQGEIDVDKLISTSKLSIFSAENQVKYQIQQQIITLAINKVSLNLKNQMTAVIQNKIIDQSIMQLKGNINI